MGDLVGYARVSTGEQSSTCSRRAEGYGLQAVVVRHGVGFLERAARAREGYRLPEERGHSRRLATGRLVRSVRHLIDLVGELEERGIGLRSLQEGIDTTTPGGRLVFHVFSALAQFEREIIIERSRAGVAAARACGRVGGRPATMTPAKLSKARRVARAWGADP